MKQSFGEMVCQELKMMNSFKKDKVNPEEVLEVYGDITTADYTASTSIVAQSQSVKMMPQ